MSELKMQCPQCSTEIELTEQLAGPMMSDLRASFDEELTKRDTQAAEALVLAEAQAKKCASRDFY